MKIEQYRLAPAPVLFYTKRNKEIANESDRTICEGGTQVKIEHVAMYVNDLGGTKAFFENYLGAKANDGYHNPRTGLRSYFLTFDDGARLEIMNKPQMEDPEKTLNRTGFVHLAFSVGSKEAVDHLTERLKNDGFSVVSGPRTTGDGYYESCVVAFEGNQIEITV